MKSKKNPQGKKEIKKIKTTPAKNVKIAKPTASTKKTAPKAQVIAKVQTAKRGVPVKPIIESVSKPSKSVVRTDKVHKIPDILKDFYRE